MRLRKACLGALLALAMPASASAHVLFEIHGGGWADQPWMAQAGYDYVRPHWTGPIYSVSYDPGSASLASVVQAYDAVRKTNPHEKIIVLGQSAGGNLALLLASVRRPWAVVVEGAPTLLTRPFPAYTQFVINYWFKGAEKAFSPAWQPLLIPAKRVVLGMSACDQLVPHDQMAIYAKHHPGARTMTLPCGDSNFTHGNVDSTGLEHFRRVGWRTAR